MTTKKPPYPQSNSPGDAVTLREAAQSLLDAQKAGQPHVGYRLDLWRDLETALAAPAPEDGR